MKRARKVAPVNARGEWEQCTGCGEKVAYPAPASWKRSTKPITFGGVPFDAQSLLCELCLSGAAGRASVDRAQSLQQLAGGIAGTWLASNAIEKNGCTVLVVVLQAGKDNVLAGTAMRLGGRLPASLCLIAACEVVKKMQSDERERCGCEKCRALRALDDGAGESSADPVVH